MKTNVRYTGTETDLYYRAEKAIGNSVCHEVDLDIVNELVPYLGGYIINYVCKKSGKFFLVRVRGDDGMPVVYINS